MLDESGRGSRSICILKEKGVCLRVPFYIGTPKVPTFVTIPYFEFVAQARMNRTNTCDMFVKGDIVRIYTQSLVQSPSYVAIVTVLKRKSSNLYVYKRKIAEILKYLPEPETKDPLRRTFEVEAIGIINSARSASMPIECYRISMKSKDDAPAVPPKDGGSESGDGGNQSTIWVEKGLYSSDAKKVIETPTLHPDQLSVSPSSLASPSSSSTLAQQQPTNGQEKGAKQEKEEVSFITKTNTFTTMPLSEMESNAGSNKLHCPDSSSMSFTVISTVSMPVKMPKPVTSENGGSPCTTSKGSSASSTSPVVLGQRPPENSIHSKFNTNFNSISERHMPASIGDFCEYPDYYSDPFTYSFSPNLFCEPYPSVPETSSLQKMLSSADTPILSPTSYSIFPLPSQSQSQSPDGQRLFSDSCDDSFNSSPFILGSELAEFEDKGEFRLSPFKFCTNDSSYGIPADASESDEVMGDRKETLEYGCLGEDKKEFGGGVDNDVHRSVASPAVSSFSDADPYAVSSFNSTISDEYFYGPLNSQIEENFRPQTCVIL